MLFRSFIMHVMCVGALKLRSIFPKNIHEIYFLESLFLIIAQPLQGFLAVPYSFGDAYMLRNISVFIPYFSVFHCPHGAPITP